ncbi:MAG: universal stress protein [Geobacteraceae bacterium]|jgi:nucleotide-binding universal stress UspA family protein
MFKKALICMESGSHSPELATCISGLLNLGIKECLVTQFLTYSEAVAASFTLAEVELQQYVEGLRQQLQEAGFVAEAKTVSGTSHREAYRLAEEHGCDLVVVECRYDTVAGEMLAGGVAASVIHHLTVPTLVVRVEVSDAHGGKRLSGKPCDFTGHALFPTDFSENADHAFAYLEELASNGLKRVTLLHVQDNVRIDPHLRDRLDEFNALDRERLNNLEARLRKKGATTVETRLSYGNPSVELLNAVRDTDPSFVVMGSQGRGFVTELFLGSVSHNMVRLSPVPILLIPRPR